MAKFMLAASLIMGLSYATEWFAAWYGGDSAERSLVSFEFTGLTRRFTGRCCCSMCVLPQTFWLTRVRRHIVAVVVIAILINIGMWLERILIVWNTLAHGYLPSMWRMFVPTLLDWSLLFGSLGLFAFLYLLLVPHLSDGLDARNAPTGFRGGRRMSGLLLAEFSGADKLLKAARAGDARPACAPSTHLRRSRSTAWPGDRPGVDAPARLCVSPCSSAASSSPRLPTAPSGTAPSSTIRSTAAAGRLMPGRRSCWSPLPLAFSARPSAGSLRCLCRLECRHCIIGCLRLPDFERASQDAFLLALDRPRGRTRFAPRACLAA